MHPRSFAVACVMVVAAAAATAQEISWFRMFDEAKRRAFEERKFIVLYFEESAVNQSFRMDRDTWRRPAVAELAKRFVCVRVDNTELSFGSNMILRDKAQKLILRYRIQYTPTVVIIDPAGNEITRLLGYTAEKELAARLASLPSDMGELSAVLSRLEKDPEAAGPKVQAGDLYRRMHMPLLSNRFYAEVDHADTLKADSALAEHVAVSRALNCYDLKELREAVDVLERVLDEHPRSPDRAFHLYMLAKAHHELLNDVAARDYMRRLEKEFPDAEWTARARDLVK
jgi:thioredoxin-related protein